MNSAILTAAQSTEVALAGGKAAALAGLLAAGFDVPAFVVLTDAAFDPDGLTEAAQTELVGLLPGLGGGLFAVRSSGREEDGASHSHAGQFLSLLHVAAAGVPGAALEVWRSGNSGSLRAYRTSRGLDAQGGAPAVIVQRLVQARAAGVAFSADPLSGRRDRIAVSAIAGFGDRLVGGEENGDAYVIDSPTGSLLRQPEGGGVLKAADLAALAQLARAVEAARGAPQDIEWAFEGERLFLLQARPITTALRPAPLADGTVSIFDNSNIVESYPGLVSPLTYSFAQYVYARVYRTFVGLVGVPARTIADHGAVFDNMLGRMDGRIYYNLINWYRALALLPGFALNRAYMESMMGVGAPLPAEIADSLAPSAAGFWPRLHEYGRMAKMGGLLVWRAVWLRRSIAHFHVRLDEALRLQADEIASLPLTQLAKAYRQIEADLLERWDAPLVNDFLCMMAFGASRKLIERWGGQAGLEAHNALMIGQGDIVSAEPAQRIAQMGILAGNDPAALAQLALGSFADLSAGHPLKREIEAYIAKFGDRCTEELKLESITLDEDPAPLLAAICAAAAARRPAVTRAAGVDALDALFAKRPVRRAVMKRLMGYAKARVRDRENLRFERTRIFGLGRRIFLAMGAQLHALGQLDQPRDIFLLTVPEVLGTIEGFGLGTDLRALAVVRCKEMAESGQRPDPAERVTFQGAALARDWASNPAAVPVANGAAMRTGTGCSSGTVRGVARVILDPRRERLGLGEILVSRHTDPGWIAVFANASAIVVERGSLLSHSAIVAREMGIPCVVGLKEATIWIRDGDRIEVDGATGTVRKIDGGQ